MDCNILLLVKVCITREMEVKFLQCASQESGSLLRSKWYCKVFLEMLRNQFKLLTYLEVEHEALKWSLMTVSR